MTTKTTLLPIDWHWTQDLPPALPAPRVRHPKTTASVAVTVRIPVLP